MTPIASRPSLQSELTYAAPGTEVWSNGSKGKRLGWLKGARPKDGQDHINLAMMSRAFASEAMNGEEIETLSVRRLKLKERRLKFNHYDLMESRDVIVRDFGGLVPEYATDSYRVDMDAIEFTWICIVVDLEEYEEIFDLPSFVPDDTEGDCDTLRDGETIATLELEMDE